MKKYFQFLLSGIVLLSIYSSGHATHIRAGEITATLISCQNYSYRFTVTGYTDLGSDVRFGGGEINYGDGVVDSFETGAYDYFEDLGDLRAINIYFKDHTFPGPGVYKISFREFNRNADIVNMDNSVQTPFYVETVIIIDPFFGCNNTPVLLNPPIDDACVGVTYLHNAGAIDADGDSLSYEFTIPNQDQGIPVVNYQFPDDHDISQYNATNEDLTGPANFSLNQRNGDIIWNAPGGEGEYNWAFRVVEWRKIEGIWYKMGYVTRDMQVNVTDCNNDPPEILPPPDTCVIAGDLLKETIIATDPNNDPIILSSFSSVYETNSSPASYTPFPDVVQASPAELNFSWQTNCSHVREREYQVNFKAVDQPDVSQGRGPKLADFKTWYIRVVGPAPEGLLAEQENGNEVRVSWDPYICNQANEMQVWRRVDSFEFEPSHCELGMPDYAGYELVTTLGINQNTFLDDNNGKGLEYGATYCYRLVAVFQDPAGGESVVSAETCVMMEEVEGEFGSLITNVSVDETDAANGQISLKWTSPFDIDITKYPGPYTYEVFRGQDFTSSQTQLISLGKISDTTFVDTGLNTLSAPYNYTIVVYDKDNNAIDTTSSASSVRLNPAPITGALELSWVADVPWSNISQKYPMHLIYRDNVDPLNPERLVLIDSVNVSQNGFLYLDDGSVTGDDRLIDTQEYCYFVTTRGTYGNPKLSEPFENNSQIACAQPNDTISPCPPLDFVIVNLNIDSICETFLNEKACDFNDFFNELNWEVNSENECDEDVRSYNIYYSETGDENTFELIDNVVNTSYIHNGLSSFKGCYKIAAVDRSGNISEPTEAICNDNCPFYEIPNVFTPNGDGINDVFQAFNTFDEKTGMNKCPRFVKSVDFFVYDRNGKEIYNNINEPEKNILIKWDGKNNQGIEMPSAVYFYQADVTFDVLDQEMQLSTFKGWVQLLK
ncbi:MAG: T9SS type B sorting domain-containing protein [Cyclobacteriaceae bacterium]|nr:T9SS type B sorting domain-containing protein [Cyclobacteriaceae bacterium]